MRKVVKVKTGEKGAVYLRPDRIDCQYVITGSMFSICEILMRAGYRKYDSLCPFIHPDLATRKCPMKGPVPYPKK